ncbi:MAG: TRAP transporter small permease [Janthinobacterium lividum]
MNDDLLPSNERSGAASPKSWVRGFSRLYLAASGLLFAVSIVLLAVDIVRRDLTGHSIDGVHEFTQLLFLYVYLLGAAALYGRNGDLVVTFITDRLPRPMQHVLGVLVDVLIVVAMVTVGWNTIGLIASEWNLVSPDLGIRLAWKSVPLAIAAFSIAGFSISSLLTRLRGGSALLDGPAGTD